MTAAEIREYLNEHIAKRTLPDELASFRILGEIAAQLAELNERAEDPSSREQLEIYGVLIKRLLVAGDALAHEVQRILAGGGDFYFPNAESLLEKWKAARR